MALLGHTCIPSYQGCLVKQQEVLVGTYRWGGAILQLLASEDESLVVRGDAFLILDLGLDVVNGIRGLHLQGDGLAGEGLDKDLHTTPQAEQQVEGGDSFWML
jgi:hypothetical protein